MAGWYRIVSALVFFHSLVNLEAKVYVHHHLELVVDVVSVEVVDVAAVFKLPDYLNEPRQVPGRAQVLHSP